MEYIALGCMTGTSLDGIDCSLIKSDGISGVKEISNNFTPYSSSIKKELLKIMKCNYLDNLEILKQLNNEYQSAINKFISKNNSKIDIFSITTGLIGTSDIPCLLPVRTTSIESITSKPSMTRPKTA